MGSSLIVAYGNDPLYLAIVWQLVELEKASGNTPTVLDVSPVVGIVGDAINRRALRLFGIPSPDVAFHACLLDAGVKLFSAPDFVAQGRSTPLSKEALEGIRETTRSALIWFSRDPEPRVTRAPWKKLQSRLLKAGMETFYAVSGVLASDPGIDTVIVLNGRFPHQRGALEAAYEYDRAVKHYEKGDKADTYWFESYSTLDRVRTQETVDFTLDHLATEEALELGREWMARRSSGGANIYARFFDDQSVVDSSMRTRRVVGFFTSSQDEFAALGPEWHVQEWLDQLLAFEVALSRIESEDVEVYLRVHPNFATKSLRSFRRERAAIEALGSRHPELRIIWHDEQVNSYSLVSDTDVVVVWDSTIGLEASAYGKPVWELAASYYDLYADVRQWFGPDQSPSPDALEFKVDTTRALRFMAYLDIREPSLSAKTIALRESITPPMSLGLRFTNILSSGGAPTPRIALESIRDSFGHRRADINLAAVRNFIAKNRRRRIQPEQ